MQFCHAFGDWLGEQLVMLLGTLADIAAAAIVTLLLTECSFSILAVPVDAQTGEISARV